MKQFYLELANVKETQLNMARVGYARKCHEIGSKLMTCTEKESHQLIEELNEASSAYKQLDNEYKALVKKYQEETLKEINNSNEMADAEELAK